MQKMELPRPINFVQVSVEIFLLSFAISSIIQEILKQIIFVQETKLTKFTEKNLNPQDLHCSQISHLKAADVFFSLGKVTLDLSEKFCLF